MKDKRGKIILLQQQAAICAWNAQRYKGLGRLDAAIRYQKSAAWFAKRARTLGLEVNI